MGKIQVNKLQFWLWLGIPCVIMLYFGLDVFFASLYGTIFTIMQGLGLLLGMIVVSLLLGVLCINFAVFRFFLIIVYMIGQTLSIIGIIASRFHAFTFLFIITIITIPINGIILIRNFKSVKNSSQSLLHNSIPEELTNLANFINWKKSTSKARTTIVSSIFLICVVLTPVFSFYPSIDTRPRSFQVTDLEMEQADLVIYWSRGENVIPTELVQVLVNTNTTISIPVNFDSIDPTNPKSADYAEGIKNATIAGARVELFTTFHFEYENITEILPDFGEKFFSFLDLHNLSIDYLCYDIESPGPDPEIFERQNASPLADNFYWPSQAADRKAEWPEVYRVMHEVGDRLKARGIQLRITALGYIVDEFDGDHDIFQWAGQPVYDDDRDYYDYISAMAYRSHGSGFPVESGNSGIYYHVTGSRNIYDGPVGVCIGNLNADPYQTQEAIVNDVRMAVAAGADSVRLFSSASWIYGWGEYPAYGEEGLEDLLEEIRTGGEAVWYPSIESETWVFDMILFDALFDLTKPFIFY